jgi:hypothetical protein
MNKKKEADCLGGNLGDLPNEKYKKFFATFDEIETLDVSHWRPVHIIGYFCKKYEEHYKTKYSFKFNSPSPTKSFEVFQIKRLAMLLSSNSRLLKEYIDWVFESSSAAKTKRRSISFITEEGLVQYYKLNVLLQNKTNLGVNRSTQLPLNYREIFQAIGITVQNYGDLAFLFQMEKSPELRDAFAKLKELGFDEEIVSRIV